MNRFVLFLKKIYVLLLFVILEIAAINYYANSTSYTRAKILTSSNMFVGWIHRGFSNIGDYFGLKKENRLLADEIIELRNELELYKASHPDIDARINSGNSIAQYSFMWASVINNSTNRFENFIMLDKGLDDGIRSNMALVTSSGNIAGYIINSNEKYSIGISILNTKFKTVGRLKNKGNVGSILWDGMDPMELTLTELDKYAPIEVGDTIVTGNSLIFPPDLVIGTVKEYEMTQENYYKATIQLSFNMQTQHKLLVVDFSDLYHRGTLEEEYFETEVNLER